MRKWLLILSLIVIALFIPTTIALAATSADVTVKATGYICGAPTLTVTWISDTELKLDWTPGADAVATMVRAKVGSMPEDRNDGYLVYNGIATTFTDTAVNLDIIGGDVYYKAWGANSDGIWEEAGDTTYIGGAGMVLIALFALAVGVSWMASRSTYYLLKILAGVAWIGVATYWNNNPTPLFAFDSAGHTIFYILFWGLAVAMFFMPMWYSKTNASGEKTGRMNIRLPQFLGGQSEVDELKERQRMATTSFDRRDTYRKRLNDALNGRRMRK